MCFSPAASFVSSALLAGVGIATLRKAKKENEKLLAFFPLLFSMQQLVGGVLWLALLHGYTGQIPFALTQIYASLVGIILPVFAPLSLLQIVEGPLRKFFMSITLLVGVMLAGYAFYVITQFGVTLQVEHECISYRNSVHPEHYPLRLMGYVAVTCLPFLLVQNPILRTIGFLSLVALAGSLYLYAASFVSMWLFFTALISSILFLYFQQEEEEAFELAKSKELISPFWPD